MINTWFLWSTLGYSHAHIRKEDLMRRGYFVLSFTMVYGKKINLMGSGNNHVISEGLSIFVCSY